MLLPLGRALRRRAWLRWPVRGPRVLRELVRVPTARRPGVPTLISPMSPATPGRIRRPRGRRPRTVAIREIPTRPVGTSRLRVDPGSAGGSGWGSPRRRRPGRRRSRTLSPRRSGTVPLSQWLSRRLLQRLSLLGRRRGPDCRLVMVATPLVRRCPAVPQPDRPAPPAGTRPERGWRLRWSGREPERPSVRLPPAAVPPPWRSRPWPLPYGRSDPRRGPQRPSVPPSVGRSRARPAGPARPGCGCPGWIRGR